MNTKSATEFDRVVGMRVAALRKSKGHSQTALGAAIGVTFQQVQKYEKGQNRIGAGRLQQIAAFLETSVGAICTDPDAQGEDASILDALKDPGAVELLRFYAEIENPESQRSVVKMVQHIAKAHADAKGAPVLAAA